MADQVVKISCRTLEAEGSSVCNAVAGEGRVVNVYGSYANALAFAETGLSTVKAVDRLTNAAGDAITQRSPAHASGQTGPRVDVHGDLVIALDDNSGSQVYYLMSNSGRQNGPQKIVVGATVAAT